MTEPECIRIFGARQHNLKNIDVSIPRGKLTVITGVSGSGKSSLAFDTLVAEGQRRYVESLSTAARQYFEQMQRPDVDRIEGLTPTLAVEQRGAAGNPRSTVATATEIYDYLRVLFARVGEPRCWKCDHPIVRQSTAEIVDAVLAGGADRLLVLAPLIENRDGDTSETLDQLVKDGFVRARIDGEVVSIDEIGRPLVGGRHTIEAVVDRLTVKPESATRLADSIELAARTSGGRIAISREGPNGTWSDRRFSTVLACPHHEDVVLDDLSPGLFSFNSPQGACTECHGLGTLLTGEGPETASEEGEGAVEQAGGPCPACGGARLRPEALAVRIDGRNLADLVRRTVGQSAVYFEGLAFTGPSAVVAAPLLDAVRHRLRTLVEVGVDYLTLDRPVSTLSGGEWQRLRLAAQIGGGLAGVCYVLDEPTVGLHARDSRRLASILTRLRDLGNTVVVVEHDAEIIRAGDYLVEIGPEAGARGGYRIAEGSLDQVLAEDASLTAQCFKGSRWSVDPPRRRSPQNGQTLELSGVTSRNLKNLDVRFPLGCLLCVTGVSGSGKSTLVADVLIPALRRALKLGGPRPGPFRELKGAERVRNVIDVDQSPIGRTPRSNPATFVGAFNLIRELFAKTREAKVRGYEPNRFSFNVKGGRCEHCEGQGTKRVPMHFLPDVYVVCGACGGSRFNRETLEIRYRGKSIADVLAMGVQEATEFFDAMARIRDRLAVLCDVGLGYLSLGQPSHTLSGGEAQRVKLAAELHKSPEGHTLYVLDEPTTGLHAFDVRVLLGVIHRLIDRGQSVLIIEHNLDVIRSADWVIDLGPEGGDGGGFIVAEGTPEQVAAVTESHTGRFLREAHQTN